MFTSQTQDIDRDTCQGNSWKQTNKDSVTDCLVKPLREERSGDTEAIFWASKLSKQKTIRKNGSKLSLLIDI